MIALCTSYWMVEDLARGHEVKSYLPQIFDFFLTGMVFLLFEFVRCLGLWLVCEVSSISELPWGGLVF